MQGTVRWFNRIKGFGFIMPNEGGSEIFAHYSHIQGEGYKNLQEGQKVEYDLVETNKGPCAHNIRLV
jgi:CspA family cold shock protein